jgi:heat shock protein HspQ
LQKGRLEDGAKAVRLNLGLQFSKTRRSRSVQTSGGTIIAMSFRLAKFALGQVVKHRIFPFRGVIFDVDPVFDNTEEWWQSIPEEVRPRKDQPFYHLLAENDDSSYVAYVSEQNLLPDDTEKPIGHPHTALIFSEFRGGRYQLRPRITH